MYLSKANPADFCAIYKDMQAQFPYVEIKAKETFLTLCRQTQYHIWLAKEKWEGKSINVGYMLVWLDTQNQVAWLEYIAVFRHRQGKGLGSEMLRLLAAEYPACRGCFLELEKSDPQDKTAQKRVSFYTQKGAFPLNVRYFYPQYTKPPKEMDLYFLPFKRSLRSLPKSDVLAAVRQAYQILHADLPHAQKLLSRIDPSDKPKDA